MDAGAADQRAAVEREGRRRFVRRTIAVGAGAFAVPTIISLDVAGAQQVTSPVPAPPVEPPPEVLRPPEVGGTTVPRQFDPGLPLQPRVINRPPTQVGGRVELPRTGAELDDLLAAGLAATAGGAALMLWTADGLAPEPAEVHIPRHLAP